MKLLDNEKVLQQDRTESLILTTQRVRYRENRLSFTSIMLEEVCSVQVHQQRFPWLAILGIVSVLAAAGMGVYASRAVDSSVDASTIAIMHGRESDAWILFSLGAVLVGMYFAVSRKMLEISSAGAMIHFRLALFGEREFAEQFCHSLESAKDARYAARQMIEAPLTNGEAAPARATSETIRG